MITGAGGGLGTHLIQMANALGASKTIAVTSSPQKEEQLNRLGATEVIPAIGDIDFSELALALTEEKGVNVIVNTVGSSLFKSCLQALAQFGRIALVGEIDGKPVNLNPAEIIFKDARLIGVSGVSKIELSKVIELTVNGKIKPTISESFQLDDVMRAYDKMVLKNSFGRITLIP
jgi:NADPH:quinone reductase-like Zn-dependent oxidoreductase